MPHLDVVIEHLVALSLPLFLVVEHLLAARSSYRVAIAVRAERRRVAQSHRALRHKALSSRRAA